MVINLLLVHQFFFFVAKNFLQISIMWLNLFSHYLVKSYEVLSHISSDLYPTYCVPEKGLINKTFVNETIRFIKYMTRRTILGLNNCWYAHDCGRTTDKMWQKKRVIMGRQMMMHVAKRINIFFLSAGTHLSSWQQKLSVLLFMWYC